MIINPSLEIKNITKFIQKYYSDNNLKGAVIGVSGGKDSAVVTGLMCKALGKENVIAVSMPCHSNEEDFEDAKLVCDHFGVEMIKFDLSKSYDDFKENVYNIEEEHLLNSDINLKPRLRMSALYYIAAMYSSIKGGTYIVAGTSNKSELYVGYFTKGGDQVHDIEVISDYTVSEVISIGEELGVPEKVLYKAPSDGLSGKTDEDKLGVTYKAIEDYIYGRPVDEETKKKIQKLHDGSRHKFSVPHYARQRIGVFVGTFDPIHNGHTTIIHYLLNHEVLDKIIVIPTGDYWDKKISTSIESRSDMLRFFENKQIEIRTDLSHYNNTFEVFDELSKVYPREYLYLLIGADNIVSLDKWKNVDDLLQSNVIVISRNGIDSMKYINQFPQKDNFMLLNGFEEVPISSTEIRDAIKKDNKEIIEKNIDDRVYRYIKEHKLYN